MQAEIGRFDPSRLRRPPAAQALDDASVAKLLRAARADKRLLARVTVQVVLRVSEYTCLRVDALVHIGSGPWLHVRSASSAWTDTPLHPNPVAVNRDYRRQPPVPASQLLY